MPNPPTELLAKSPRYGKPPITLEQHLLDAEQAASLIFRLEGRWGRNWCRFFRLDDEASQRKLLLNLRIAALFHDIGKANADFYAAVTTPGFKAQTLRHEHLSALVLCLPEVRTWLSGNSALDVDAIAAAVLSHHLKASASAITVRGNPEESDRLRNYRWGQPQSDRKIVVLYLQHAEVTAILNRIADIAQLDKFPIPKLPDTPWSTQDTSAWSQASKQGRSAANQFSRRIRQDPQRQLFLAAVKAGLIVADSAASGLVRTDQDIADWITEVVHGDALTPESIAQAIIHPILGKIKARREGQPFDREAFLATHTPAQLQDLEIDLLQEFQKQIPQQGSRALLLAACGAGKTLGAWKWAEEQARVHDIGKIIFLYPTRGTASEGFRDYVGWAPGTEGALVTGTARYELEAMQENPSEAIKGKDFQADERLYALGFWSRRYFSATVDQFLSFLEHSYQSLCLLPALADSAVIIDEVHSFDQKMFQSLVSFLQHFQIPVLCMTATLPPSRRKQLEDLGLKVYPTADDRTTLPDLRQKEEHNRYYLEPVDNFDAAFSKAVTAYRAGERVLWVVNTVDRCLAIAQKLRTALKDFNAEVLTYHSRFRLCDRQAVHAKTTAAFAYQQSGEDRKPAIAVTTQVCEMSLDLDADVLISEVAPIPSLVQRFGRANRHLARGSAFQAKLHTYSPPPKSIRPYTKEELEDAGSFIQDLRDRAISQRDLAEKLEHYSPPERITDGSTRFLDSGYYAIPGSFRDTDDYAVPCILDRDLETVKAILESKETYRKEPYLISIPKRWATARTEAHHWLPKYLQVAPWEGHYQEDQGFITKSLEEVDLG
jgi:CRISPR-associated endonuclease/helicase Cas3